MPFVICRVGDDEELIVEAENSEEVLVYGSVTITDLKVIRIFIIIHFNATLCNLHINLHEINIPKNKMP